MVGEFAAEGTPEAGEAIQESAAVGVLPSPSRPAWVRAAYGRAFLNTDFRRHFLRHLRWRKLLNLTSSARKLLGKQALAQGQQCDGK